MKKKALITGVTGQDGSYLAEFLLDKGYEVHGIRRASSVFNTQRIDHITSELKRKNNGFYLHYGDLTDSSSINRLIEQVTPDEIYNLAAQSHVHLSFQLPDYTAQVDALGTLRLLDAIKKTGLKTKFYQASTSELFGNALEIPQTEKTPFHPRSPYGVAKLYAYWITVNYREAYNMFSCNGILFNHESERRGGTFVTKKITMAVSRIKKGIQEKLYLGNLDAKRDWGYAKDFVEAMWLILQAKIPDDYIIATNETHTVREFCEKAFEYVGIKIVWKGKGVNEKGVDKKTNKVLVAIDPIYFRPADVNHLLGDSSKARKVLKWKPKVTFEKLVEIMMRNDMLS